MSVVFIKNKAQSDLTGFFSQSTTHTVNTVNKTVWTLDRNRGRAMGQNKS